MSDGFNVGAVSAAITSMVVYHCFSYGSILFGKKTLSNVQLARNIRNSSLWFDKHKTLKDAPTVTLAIQTLRNTILIAIFIGGFSFQYAWLAMNSVPTSPTINDEIRFIIIAILLFSSFLCWANTIRMASHMGYVVGTLDKQVTDVENAKALLESKTTDVEANDNGKEETVNPTATQPPGIRTDKAAAADTTTSNDKSRQHVEKLERDLKRNQTMLTNMLWNFSLGFRYIFCAIPFQFYAAGPIALLIATGVMLMFLYHADHGHIIPLRHALEGEDIKDS